MAHPHVHSQSSARRFGGVADDYQPLHDWMDGTKRAWADPRHRAILHNTYGIWLGQELFGQTIVNADGRAVPVRAILEQHVVEDMGRIPTIEGWLQNLPTERWMLIGATVGTRKIVKLLATPSD